MWSLDAAILSDGRACTVSEFVQTTSHLNSQAEESVASGDTMDFTDRDPTPKFGGSEESYISERLAGGHPD